MTDNSDDVLEQLVSDPHSFVQRATQPLAAHVAQLQQDLTHQRLTANQERVSAAFDKDPALSGRWRELNTDAGFLAWLNHTDPLSGARRGALLQQAHDLGDVQRCRNFFMAFLAERTPPTTRTAERLPLETTRARARITTTNLEDPKRIWDRAEISAFYEDCRRGHYEGHEAERAQIESAIVRAAAERRVLNPPFQGLR